METNGEKIDDLDRGRMSNGIPVPGVGEEARKKVGRKGGRGIFNET